MTKSQSSVDSSQGAPVEEPEPAAPSSASSGRTRSIALRVGLLLAMSCALISLGALLQWLSPGFGAFALTGLLFGALPVLVFGKGVWKQAWLNRSRPRLILLGALVGLLNYVLTLMLHAVPLALFDLSAQDQAAVFEGLPLVERIGLVLAICLAAPLFEEFAFRGVLQPRLAAHLTPRWAILAAALCFAAIHFNLAGLGAIVELGLVLGLLAYWSGSLWPAIAAHAIHNIVTLIIFAIGSEASETASISDLGNLSPWALGSFLLTANALRAFRAMARCAND
ncbi:MAG: CPBP family intramembrane metalloprotease [Myxococcales bacterium]|jgi:membrane protease YdiL (CAAX protease family)|nr:CPBP family intramembrane metalloprotease [Myxococcales bacterium]